MAPGAQAQTCLGCHQPKRQRRRDPRHSRIRRRRGEHRNGHRSPNVHGRTDFRRPLDSLARRSGEPHRVHATAPTSNHHLRQGHRCERPGQGVPRRGHHRSGDEQRTRRTMDCVDCHNTVDIPFPDRRKGWSTRCRRAGELNFLCGGKAFDCHGLISQRGRGGERHRSWRSRFLSDARGPTDARLARSVAALQDVYRRNVFPTMKVTWGAYPTTRAMSPRTAARVATTASTRPRTGRRSTPTASTATNRSRRHRNQAAGYRLVGSSGFRAPGSGLR